MANYVLLERITVGAAGASSVTFNNIPQTNYTDLKIVASVRETSAQIDPTAYISFNGSSANFSYKWLYGSGTASGYLNASTNQLWDDNGSSATVNNYGVAEFYIPNYTSSNYKSFSFDTIQENNGTYGSQVIGTGLWSTSSAITSITFTPSSGTFVQYSTFSLYGVSSSTSGVPNTAAPYALGGDIIQTDGTYWYHAFLTSGTFNVKKAMNCDVLVVAGGGSGGNRTGNAGGGGGGGAGGVFYASSNSLAANTAQSIIIGAGGAGVGNGTEITGNNGSNSTFGSLTAAVGGGGGGGSVASPAGVNGGSGGGGRSRGNAGGSSTQTSTGGTGYGNAGGTGGSGADGGGGGGGAGASGASTSSGSNGGAGGIGLNTWSTWLSTTGLGDSGYIAGGGGGGAYSGGSSGAGGTGGGGAGSYNTGATSALPNTGGGGGATGASTSGTWYSGAGGSGLVIVRYAI